MHDRFNHRLNINYIIIMAMVLCFYLCVVNILFFLVCYKYELLLLLLLLLLSLIGSRFNRRALSLTLALTILSLS